MQGLEGQRDAEPEAAHQSRKPERLRHEWWLYKTEAIKLGVERDGAR